MHNMSDVGIAIVFDEVFTATVAERQNRLVDEFNLQPPLSTVVNLPHITLLQIAGASEDGIEASRQAIAEIAGKVRPFPIHLESVVYQPEGWYFWVAARDDRLRALHDHFFDALKSHLHPPSAQKKGIESYSAAERSAYTLYGYRYIGEAFFPHVTVGRSASGYSEVALLRCRQIFEATTVVPARITLYKQGENGSHSATLDSRRIAGA